MEPLDDQELSELLRQWTAPPAPPVLAGESIPAIVVAMAGDRDRSHPVPVGIAAVVLARSGFIPAAPVVAQPSPPRPSRAGRLPTRPATLSRGSSERRE